MEKVQTVTAELTASLLDSARKSPRCRTNYNFHKTPEENPNRFLNVMLQGSYFTPHRHITPPKAESFLVLQGQILCIIFDHAGEITAAHRLGEGHAYGVDIAAGVWHTIVVLSESAVCYEVKPGPYVAATDKEFAPWAPREGEAGCAAYLANLLARAQQLSG